MNKKQIFAIFISLFVLAGIAVQAQPIQVQNIQHTCSNFGYNPLGYGFFMYCLNGNSKNNTQTAIWAASLYGNPGQPPRALAVAYIAPGQNTTYNYSYVLVAPNTTAITCTISNTNKECLVIKFGQEYNQYGQYYIMVELNGYQIPIPTIKT